MLTYILTIDPPGGIRRENCITECGRLGLDFSFIDGVTGDSDELRQAYSPLRNLFFFRRSLTPGEIACYLGHRRMWQAFVESGADIALFCEDDFQSRDDAAFADVIARVGGFRDWDILKLFDFAPKRVLHSVDLGKVKVVDYKYPAAGNVCYVLRRHVAERLLSRKVFFRPVDEEFAHCWEFDLWVRSVLPNPVIEAAPSLGGSYLHAERASIRKDRNYLRSLWGKFLLVHKNLRAWLYRRRIFRRQLLSGMDYLDRSQ